MNALRTLVISPDFPPNGGPQSLQSWRLTSALLRSGFQVDVLAASNPPRKVNQHLDESRSLPAGLTVYPYERTRGILSNWPRLHRLIRPFDPYEQLRDLSRVAKLRQDTNYDAVISVSEPLVSHYVCQNMRWIRRPKCEIYWFSDPVPTARSKQSMMRFRWRRRLCENVCRKAVVRASAVVGVTKEILDPILELEKAARPRTFVLPHVFDPSEWNQSPRKPDGCFRIVHSGALYWKRTPYTLLEGAELYGVAVGGSRLEIHLQGALADEISGTVNQMKFAGFKLVIDGPKPYSKSKELLCFSDLLCIIDVELERNVHLPSKVADYVAARRPILYIGNPDSPTVRSLAGHPAFAVARNPREVADGIARLARRAVELSPEAYNQVCDRFSLRTAYAALFEHVMSQAER